MAVRSEYGGRSLGPNAAKMQTVDAGINSRNRNLSHLTTGKKPAAKSPAP